MYWELDLSPAEEAIVFEGHRQQQRAWYELGLFIAWYSAAFQRTKRLPKFDSVLKQFRGTDKQKTAMDWRAMKATMHSLKDIVPGPLSDKEQRTLARRAKGKR